MLALKGMSKSIGSLHSGSIVKSHRLWYFQKLLKKSIEKKTLFSFHTQKSVLKKAKFRLFNTKRHEREI